MKYTRETTFRRTLCFLPHKYRHQYYFRAGIPITSKKDLARLPYYKLALDKSFITQEEHNNIVSGVADFKTSNYPDADQSLNKVAGRLAIIYNLNGFFFFFFFFFFWKLLLLCYWAVLKKNEIIHYMLERAINHKYIIYLF